MTKTKHNPKNARRKLFDGKEENLVLQKLEEAYALDCTDEEACFYADISPAALYAYQKKNPKFLERKHALKQNPVLIARKTVVDKLPGDADLSLKYLERKKKSEFSVRAEYTGKDGGAIKVVPLLGGDSVQKNDSNREIAEAAEED